GTGCAGSGGSAKNTGRASRRYSRRRSMLGLCYRRMAGDLAERLIEASELHGDFVLSSGRRSKVYFVKFRFLADPDLLRDVASAVHALVPDGVTHLASPEVAAILILSAVAL